MAKKGKKDLTKILISLIFIAYGIDSVVRILLEVADLDLGNALTVALASAVGVLMFITGIVGLCKVNINVCRVLAVIVCILSAATFITGLLGLTFQTQMLVQALFAWIYFDCT